MTAELGTVVIVGASVAGIATARALRTGGHDGQIVLLSGEDEWPYNKPPLSKKVLVDGWEGARLPLVSTEDADKLSLDIRLGHRAASLAIAELKVVLETGDEVAFDACVVATGCQARPSPWPVRSGIHVLRTLDDAKEIRTALLKYESVGIVGAGFIGAEVAGSARALGRRVTVVDPVAVPMARIVGPRVGAIFSEVAVHNGVDLHLGVGVERIDGEAGAFTLHLTDGTDVSVATVVVGIGAVPNDGWLASSGLEIDNGVVCDQFCRASSDGVVYAAGDVARWWNPDLEMLTRVEQWTNAIDQAGCVAHNLLHPEELRPYTPLFYVWSDQHEAKFQIVGRTAAAETEVVIGDLDTPGASAAVIYGDGTGRAVGAFTANWPRAVAKCRRAIADGTTTDDLVGVLSDRPASVA